jgi:hypothetical protein
LCIAFDGVGPWRRDHGPDGVWIHDWIWGLSGLVNLLSFLASKVAGQDRCSCDFCADNTPGTTSQNIDSNRRRERRRHHIRVWRVAAGYQLLDVSRNTMARFGSTPVEAHLPEPPAVNGKNSSNVSRFSLRHTAFSSFRLG